MLGKLFLFGVVVCIIYIIFFKKREQNDNQNSTKDENSNTMVECETCGLYVAASEVIYKNGHYFCSKNCVGEQNDNNWA